MEPGHEDREYAGNIIRGLKLGQASMEPGHEDREYGMCRPSGVVPACSLNGARP